MSSGYGLQQLLLVLVYILILQQRNTYLNLGKLLYQQSLQSKLGEIKKNLNQNGAITFKNNSQLQKQFDAFEKALSNDIEKLGNSSETKTGLETRIEELNIFIQEQYSGG